jgi:hypothetical protein
MNIWNKARELAELMMEDVPEAIEKPAAPKPRLRVYMGGLVTALAIKIALGIETAATVLARWNESKREQHGEGTACPHCSGTGRYHFHTDATRNERCFRCNGKGKLDTKDLGFLDRRLAGKGPVCWVTSATAA